MERGSQLLSGVCCCVAKNIHGFPVPSWELCWQKTLVIEGVGCQVPTASLYAKGITETNLAWSAKRISAETHVLMTYQFARFSGD